MSLVGGVSPVPAAKSEEGSVYRCLHKAYLCRETGREGTSCKCQSVLEVKRESLNLF